MERKTRYPSYDVMEQKFEWDGHTRRIVETRLHTSGKHAFLTLVEAETLRALCALLIDDDRPDVLQYILDHIDHTLHTGTESERKDGSPPIAQLMRKGLETLDEACQHLHTDRFFHIETEKRKQWIRDLQHEEASPAPLWQDVPQKVFFKKLLSLTVEAYASHPTIWSDIGYAGPAYPRGYIRMHPGQLDSWEPREEHTQ